MNLSKLFIALSLCMLLTPMGKAAEIIVASKQFTESHVLAELAAGIMEQAGNSVERKLGLGGTLVVFNALQAGEIDVYPDYTGTLAQSLLTNPKASRSEVDNALAAINLEIVAEFGFNNTYVLAMRKKQAETLAISRISDLVDYPELRPAFSLEFLNRNDGWPALRDHYQLPQKVKGIEHALSYPALSSGQSDLTDAYSTDGELLRFKLELLEDDRNFFPRYDAVLVARSDLDPAIKSQLQALNQLLDERSIQELNVAAGDGDPSSVAKKFLAQEGLYSADYNEQPSTINVVMEHTKTHIKLTGIALLLACIIAIPLGLVLAHYPRRAAAAVYVAGLLQTIPSLALLALMIPLLGLGQVPAICALFLYSLLPILRNTLTGIDNVDPLLKQVADGMGLTPWQRLRRIELPLALPTILAGVKTAAIISIGTATLAAFVGAGGLGEPIITGLTLNNHKLILLGAIPAACLAIVTELMFELLERRILVVSGGRGTQ